MLQFNYIFKKWGKSGCSHLTLENYNASHFLSVCCIYFNLNQIHGDILSICISIDIDIMSALLFSYLSSNIQKYIIVYLYRSVHPGRGAFLVPPSHISMQYASIFSFSFGIHGIKMLLRVAPNIQCFFLHEEKQYFWNYQ